MSRSTFKTPGLSRCEAAGRVPSPGESAPKKFQALENLRRKSSKPRRIRVGFTLIEVLLAMAILGICMTGLLAAVSQSLSVARRVRIYDTARNLIARVELEQPLLLEEEIEEGSEEGDFDGNPQGYRWQRIIEAVETGSASADLFDQQEDLFQVTTRVTWEQRGREQFEEVVTYIYLPDQQEDQL